MLSRIVLSAAGLLATITMAPPVATAQHEGETREAHSHVHGVMDIVVSVQGNAATIELQSPMWNLVGFEHAPSNQIEADKWVAAANRLKRPDSIAKFPVAASCSLVSSELGAFAGAAGSGAKEHPDAAEAPSHDDQQDHHEHEGHHEHDGFHDAVLGWTYNCGSPDAIRSVTFELFSSFPGVESANAVLLTDNGQASGIVHPASNSIRLR